MFDGLAHDNTCGYFASFVVFFRGPLVSYAKPSNKRFIIPLPKNCYFAIGFYFFGKSIQKHPDSVCEDDVNNEQNVRTLVYAKPLNERLIILLQRKCYFGFYFLFYYRVLVRPVQP